MNTTVWNCQGLGVDPTVRRLKKIQRKYFPDILCLLETKQKDDYVHDLICDLGYDRCVTVPPQGMSGGIVVLWKKYVYVSVLFQSPNLVDCFIEMTDVFYYLSFIYGFPDQSMRHLLWERLERMTTTREEPWLIMGDFNEIRSNDEKSGGPACSERSFVDFRRMIYSVM